MNVAYMRTLFDYTFWANHELWACIEQLSDAQFAQPVGYSRGSIYDLVLHMMDADNTWISRLRGTSPRGNASRAEYPTRAAIRAAWDKIEADMRAYLGRLSEATLAQTLHYQRKDGAPQADPVWAILLHVANHSTDHRATLLGWLHDLGIATFEQDFIFYMRKFPPTATE